MLTKNQKRLILSYFALLISFLIWNVNQNIFGNGFEVCFILSLTTFLITFTPFEIYWSFQDFWYERWKSIDSNELSLSKIQITVSKTKKGKSRQLIGLLISSKDENLIKSKNTIIIVCHGFSDTKESLQFFYIPLALQGYIILTYDARGTKGSKKVGKKHQFLARIEDYKKIIDWIRRNNSLNSKKIVSVGFSIGAMTVLCGSFANKEVSKIIAISSISIYNNIFRNFNPVVLLNYILKGVSLFPNIEKSRQLSPYLIMSELKGKISTEEWRTFAERVLLIHAENDRVIKFFNFEENRTLLDLSNTNYLVLNKGGHNQKKNELALVSKALQFLSA